MQQNEPTLDEMRRMAQDIGLDRLDDEQLAQLRRAALAARARRTALPFDTLTAADEPAHVYRPGTGGDA